MSATFQYNVRDPLGKHHDGSIQAASLDDARQRLQQDGFQVLELKQGGAGGALLQRRIGRKDIVYATSQLAIMVDTGTNLSVALASLADQETNPAMRELLRDLKRSVESGEDFSAALEKHPRQFDHTYVSLVRASEATGSLGEMLERIALYLRKEMDTRGKIRSAMAYPMVMAIVAVAVTIFLLTYILPKFEPLFSKKGDRLPGITVVMMRASDSLIGYWYLWLAGLVALVAGFLYYRRTLQGRRMIDWVKINAPIVGPMSRKVAISRSVRTLGTMMASGVSILDALQLSADVAGNYHYERIWRRVLDRVTSGNQIYETMAESPLFPSMLVQMMRSGEETGKLDVVLDKVSTFYDSEVEMTLKTTTSLIEPLMITVMGLVVGGIAMSLLLPIFSLGR